MASRFALLLVVAACASPDTVFLSNQTGSAVGLGDCHCTYYDGTTGDADLQILCVYGNASLENASFFLNPLVPGREQGMQFIFANQGGQLTAGASGQFASLGKARRAGSSLIVRALEGVQVSWGAQTACDVVSGCVGSSVAITDGAFTASGDCEDQAETQAQNIGN